MTIKRVLQDRNSSYILSLIYFLLYFLLYDILFLKNFIQLVVEEAIAAEVCYVCCSVYCCGVCCVSVASLLMKNSLCRHCIYRGTEGQNREKHRMNTHPIIHCPTSKGVSEMSERASKRAQQSRRVKRVVWSKQTSEKCE